MPIYYEAELHAMKVDTGLAINDSYVLPTKLSDALLDDTVTLVMEETDTVILYSAAAVRVQADTTEYRDVLAANERYDSLTASIARAGAEMYPSRGTDTLNPPTKNKEAMTTQAPTAK